MSRQMRSNWRVASALISLSLCLAAIQAPASAGVTVRVSVGSLGEEGNGGSQDQAISADGRFVGFDSVASNLVPDDSNGVSDVFLHDRLSGITERVSVSSSGMQANGAAGGVSLSPEGRFVAFDSYANNLVPGDTNGWEDGFVRDRLTGITERVTVSSSRAQGNGDSQVERISADGRFVAFCSLASNLVPGDTNGCRDVFVRDGLTGVTERVSVSNSGEQGNGDSNWGYMSDDGRFVGFWSLASNLVSEDTNGRKDGFVRDRLAETTERVSVSSSGDQGNDDSQIDSLSANGRFAAFSSVASNLVPGDTNGCRDVFVRDRWTGVTERVSVGSFEEQGNAASSDTDISPDGRFVAFCSDADNLAPGDTNGHRDVFVRDRLAGSTERVSVSTSGEQALGRSNRPFICAGGRLVAFQSEASDLIPNDTNGCRDVFVRDRWPETVLPETRITFGPCGLVISTERAAMCWAGTDNETVPPGLRYAWRLDSGGWQPFSYGTCAELTGLSAGAHLFQVVAKDVAENVDPTPAQCQFTVDLSGPSVSISSPAYGATVAGLVGISATAAHVSGIQEVEFYAAGQLVSADVSAPYSCVWDTALPSVPEGTTQVCAKAHANDGKVSWACTLVAVDNTTFDDVPKTSSQWADIEALVRAGITSGCSGNPPLYCPSSSITRAQMAVFIIRAMGAAPYNNPTPTFEDVPNTHWAYGYIETMHELGITGGCSTAPMRYCPGSAVNRSQMAVFLCRAAAKAPINPGTPTFADVPATAPFYGYVERLADPASWGGTAVTSGCAANPPRYCPYSPVTRGQMAVFLVRAFAIAL